MRITHKNIVVKFLVIFLVWFVDNNNQIWTEKLCQLPSQLEFHKFHVIQGYYSNNQFLSETDVDGLRLDVPNHHYRFHLTSWLAKINFSSCYGNQYSLKPYIHVRFPKNYTLSKHFKLRSLMKFLLLFKNKNSKFRIYFANLHSIEVDLGKQFNSSWSYYNRSAFGFFYEIYLHNTRLDFRLKGKPVKTCQQLMASNQTKIKSVFQIDPKKNYIYIGLLNPRFVRPLCPLLFKYSRISFLDINGIVNTFYKRNVLSFTNDTLKKNIYSEIYNLKITKSENIELDATLLNPIVFKDLESKYFK